MNERIWELKRQAMLFAQEKCDGQTTDMHGNLRSNIWTEKFAELIVNQCADIAQQHNKSPVAAPLAIGYVIREHFGVKE
jgi:hypothetical protein